MTTEEAFEKLINTKCWFKLVGISSSQAAAIKSNYKHNLLRLDSIIYYLQTAGGVIDVSIVSPTGECIDNYKDAFEEMIQLPNIHIALGLKKHYFYEFQERFWKTSINIATMHKYLEKAGYKISANWELPPEISTIKIVTSQNSPTKRNITPNISLNIDANQHFTAINSNYTTIVKTASIFEKLIHQYGWYALCSNIDFAQSQLIEYRFQRGEIYLEEIIDILTLAGYTYDLSISAPYGKSFNNFKDAYKYLSFIRPPKSSLYDFLNMSTNDIEKINKHFGQSYVCVDMIFYYLIKTNCQICINWHNTKNKPLPTLNTVTEDAFEELIAINDLHNIIDINNQLFIKAKKLHKTNKLNTDTLYRYLDLFGYAGRVQIIYPPQKNKIFYNYLDAFEHMLSLQDTIDILNTNSSNRSSYLYNKLKKTPEAFKISTIYNHLTTTGYQIKMYWGQVKSPTLELVAI